MVWIGVKLFILRATNVLLVLPHHGSMELPTVGIGFTTCDISR